MNTPFILGFCRFHSFQFIITFPYFRILHQLLVPIIIKALQWRDRTGLKKYGKSFYYAVPNFHDKIQNIGEKWIMYMYTVIKETIIKIMLEMFNLHHTKLFLIKMRGSKTICCSSSKGQKETKRSKPCQKKF